MLLNEMVSHQENKDEMISYQMVMQCLCFMGHEEAEVRKESTNLLGTQL